MLVLVAVFICQDLLKNQLLQLKLSHVAILDKLAKLRLSKHPLSNIKLSLKPDERTSNAFSSIT